MMSIEGYAELLKVLYAQEVNLFNLAAPNIKDMTVPKVYWAGINDSQGQAICIMEDLSKDYTIGNPENDWPVDRVKKGVEQLAALHANTLGTSATEKYPWLKFVYPSTMIGLALQWGAMVLAPGLPPIPEPIRNQERAVPAMKKHYAINNPKFLAVLHADPHTGNTYLDAKGNPYFLDHQTLTIGSVFHDLTYFVNGALSVEDRRAHEMEILDHYLETLARYGGPTLSKDEEDVIEEYKRCTLSGMGWVLTPFAMQREERVFAMCKRYCAAMLDHKAIELVESLPEPSTN